MDQQTLIVVGVIVLIAVFVLPGMLGGRRRGRGGLGRSRGFGGSRRRRSGFAGSLLGGLVGGALSRRQRGGGRGLSAPRGAARSRSAGGTLGRGRRRR